MALKFQVKFNGKRYGDRYDIVDGPTGIRRNDGWTVDKEHSEKGVTIVWIAENDADKKNPVTWLIDQDPALSTTEVALTRLSAVNSCCHCDLDRNPRGTNVFIFLILSDASRM